MLVRSPVVAGIFYPNDPKQLKETIEDFLRKAIIGKQKNKARALIVPHAGYIYSAPVAAYGFKYIENYSYKKIILIGPSHHFAFDNLVSFPQGYWETPFGKVETLSKNDFLKLKNAKYLVESFKIHEPEHCLEVQLPFLQTVLSDFKIFPLLTGNITDYQKIGQDLSSIYDEETLFLISSDFSHYLSYNEAKMVDKVSVDSILAKDIDCFEKYGEACGKESIKILLSLANKYKWQAKLLCAMNSGETSGNKNQVVGYASIVFYE